MRTMRFRLPVLDKSEEGDFLDLVTRVPGVVAALVEEASATLSVVVSGQACALLVREQLEDALLLSSTGVAA